MFRLDIQRFLLLLILLFLITPLVFSEIPQEIKITDARDTVFTVSWVTDSVETCRINYGTTPSLGSTAYDSRGSGYSDDTHYVTISGLSQNRLYYFDIVSGGVTYNNGEAHYTCATGPTIGLPNSDTVYGRVFKSDGTTLAQGTIVYISLQDNNGVGSSGSSAQMSALVDSSGYWYTNLGNARTQNLSGYFSYSASGDNLILSAQGAGDGTASQTVNTNNDYPAPNMVLSTIVPPQIKITDVRDTVFTVSWITNAVETCRINYGTTPSLGSTAYDSRGSSYSDDTHYVTISGLSQNRLYYFDIVSGGVTYNNGEAHYTCATGPTIGLPNSDTVYGRVFKSDIPALFSKQNP